jgi:hypothetical protein
MVQETGNERNSGTGRLSKRFAVFERFFMLRILSPQNYVNRCRGKMCQRLRFLDDVDNSGRRRAGSFAPSVRGDGCRERSGWIVVLKCTAALPSGKLPYGLPYGRTSARDPSSNSGSWLTGEWAAGQLCRLFASRVNFAFVRLILLEPFGLAGNEPKRCGEACAKVAQRPTPRRPSGRQRVKIF